MAVTQDKLAMVGTFHGAMGNDIVDATSDTSHTFVVMGDHHYRSECAIRVMENTDDREDMIGRYVQRVYASVYVRMCVMCVWVWLLHNFSV